MDIKKYKLNPDWSKIKFNGTVFRDINEFIIDLQNIFTQMNQIYQKFKLESKNIKDKKQIKELEKQIIPKITELQDELQQKLQYITDEKKVNPDLVGENRGKLVQLKSLVFHTDLSNNTEENLNKLTDFFKTRVLSSNIAITGKIFLRKRE